MLDLEKIKALRLKAGLTQDQAAKKANMGGRASWNHIESGRKANVTMQVLGKLARALGVKPRDLIK